jgi:DNA polymerase elongation subunit (family B)
MCNDIVFQALDWTYYDTDNNSDSDIKEFIIRIFGKTKSEDTVYCEVTGFKPFFYIKLRQNWNPHIAMHHITTAMKNLVYPKDKADGFIEDNTKIVKEKDFYGFTNYEKFNYLKFYFHSYESLLAYANIFNKKIKIPQLSQLPIKIKTYEANQSYKIPLLRFMHINDLSSTGWLKIEEDNCDLLPKTTTCCKYNYTTEWNNIKKIDDISVSKFKIMAYDLECMSIDGKFPKPEIDENQIIQIGITMSKVGETECYYKHLLSLHETSPIEGTIVEWFDKEKNMLIAFTKLLRTLDPDIVTGYNIFGFDFNYLKVRAKKLGIQNQFERLSRITGEATEWKESELKSAAMGTVITKYYNMTGRIVIDLLKVIQREHNLSSYSLNNVATIFINEAVTNIINTQNNTCEITTKSTYGIIEGNYIALNYNNGSIDSKCNEGKKYKIININDKCITIEGNIDTSEYINKGYKIFWCQVKDDMLVNDIFKLFKGTPDDRAKVGKYCIQDCVLCNKLIAKLQIMINSISMADVCSVPLSWLFTRGQGAKIYSLVLRVCRLKHHLIPDLKKPKIKNDEEYKKAEKIDAKFQHHIEYLSNKTNQYNEFGDNDSKDNDEDCGYEGAIVFTPEPKVHYDPITVLDFASLYPNAMKLRNLSHECYVNDPKYDNIPGYKYHIITYKNNDGTFKTCKFAQKLDGSMGIIPEILTYLLTTRSQCKKQMEKEKDLFIINILNGKQLAYKITANSLYGQTGASVSPIFMKEIAASTTSTGREFLLFSKYFIEVMFYNAICAAIKPDNKEEYIKVMNDIYKYYPTQFNVQNAASADPNEMIDIHVNTLEKEKIHEAKFIKSFIGYGQKYSLIANNQHFFDNIGMTEKEFVNIINGFDVCKRDMFLRYMKKYVHKINNNQNSKSTINKIIAFVEFVNMYKCIKYITEDFVTNLEICINQMGYSGKEQFFEKMYIEINRILKNYSIKPQIIYGDTDSIFYNMHIKNEITDKYLEKDDRTGLKICIPMGVLASLMIGVLLPTPMAQEYEKVLWPLILQGKKRYVGNLYELDPYSFKQKSMGIELKRRDNAPIVKIACSGVVDLILNKYDPIGAYNFIDTLLKNILSGKYSLDMFVISKTLKGHSLTKIEQKIEEAKPKESRSYVNRASIVHAVLADRMAERDPGNKPLSNDRIPYAYVEVKHNVTLQGERVETPTYIIENGLKLDYLFYITNQLEKPLLKFLELIIEQPEKLFKRYIIMEENIQRKMIPICHYANKDNSNISVVNNEYDTNDYDIINDDLLNIESTKNKFKSRPKHINKVITNEYNHALKIDESDNENDNIITNKKLIKKTVKKKKTTNNIVCFDDDLFN